LWTKNLIYCPDITYSLIDVDTNLDPDTDIFYTNSNYLYVNTALKTKAKEYHLSYTGTINGVNGVYKSQNLTFTVTVRDICSE
jgi:hypothetical protein